MVLPIPGTEANRSSLARQTGEPRTRVVDIAVDFIQFLLQHGDMTGQTFANADVGRPLVALAFGNDHVDDLTPSPNQFGKQARSLVRQRARGAGRTASAKCAITPASTGSVLARLPTACAKWRI